MSGENPKPLKLFYCYAREDKDFRDELDRHLSYMKRKHHITSWSDREISPGAVWEKEIDTQLNSADLILLLISSHFMASDYCYGIEMKHALDRHETGMVRVVPIILRRVYWEDAPFSKLQVLPADARPVSQWQDRDEAYWNITLGIIDAIKDLSIARWVEEGKTLHALKRYDEALAAYDQALQLDPKHANAQNNKGITLHALKRYDEALTAYDQALHLDPKHANAQNNKGNTLHILKRYDKALAAYDQALHLDPKHVDAWNNKGITLHILKRYDEALAAYDQALHLDPKHADARNNKGIIFDQALQLDPKPAEAWNDKHRGKYELVSRLALGGMSEIWKAHDPQSGRNVAIKSLHTDLQYDPEFITRFTNDARIIASLHHPNIVQIYDFQVSTVPKENKIIAYIVMDFVEGQTLADYIRNTSRKGKFPSGMDIVYIFRAISRALDYAHERGIIHRDIKPANILLDQRTLAAKPIGEPILTDFGIARSEIFSIPTEVVGMLLGTPLYIAPEQAQGKSGDKRSDLYSLGIILYEMITGVTPFRSEATMAILVQHIHEMPTPPSMIRSNIPPLLSEVILKSISKQPDDRFQCASDMTMALAQALGVPFSP